MHIFCLEVPSHSVAQVGLKLQTSVGLPNWLDPGTSPCNPGTLELNAVDQEFKAILGYTVLGPAELAVCFFWL